MKRKRGIKEGREEDKDREREKKNKSKENQIKSKQIQERALRNGQERRGEVLDQQGKMQQTHAESVE